MRPFALTVFVTLLLGMSVLIVLAQNPTPTSPNMSTDRDANRPGLRIPSSNVSSRIEKATEAKKRIREGTVFKKKRAIFRVSGSRVSLFSEDETERFLCIENLNLERIVRFTQENPTQQVWSVDGFYTEYFGENHVFIQRAVLAAPKVPDTAVSDSVPAKN